MRRFLRLFCVCVLVGLAGYVSLPSATPVFAQAEEMAPIVDYADWETVAVRAEDSVLAAEASDEAFTSLRGQIVDWRTTFAAAQSTNAVRIRTLTTQITALGPVPAEGETEDPEIALRRNDLNAQLNVALAPVRRAEEAFSRADGLVREIDRVLRERTAKTLLQLGPTPINPALWPAAISALVDSLKGVVVEFNTSWNSPAKHETFRRELPLTLLYLGIAVLLLARGRLVMVRMTSLVLERFQNRARALAGFLTSLGQIILPVLGIALLVLALQSTGLLGLGGQRLTGALPIFGLMLFGSRWLMLRLFPKRADITHILPTDPLDSRRMRYYGTGIGLLLGLATLLGRIADYEQFSDPVKAVLFFPLVALMGYLLIRAGGVLVRTARTARSDMAEGESAFGAQLLMIAGRLTSILGVIGIGLSAVGYLNAGVYLIIPTAFSLALLGALLVLNDLMREIYALATRSDPQEARDALMPTLLAMLLALCSMPIFALFWGARVSDLTELWATFQAGFSLGDTKISPSNFITFVVVFSALFIGTRLIQAALRSSVLPKTKIDIGGQTAIISGLGYVGIFLAALAAITSAGIDLSSLAIVAGALSVGIGFGLQNIVSNFVSGIILLIERPISQGDWIEVGGNTGIVKDISVRSTRIETFDKIDVIVPNADFVSSSVKNWTRGNVIGRVIVPVGVAYGTDTRRVVKILQEIAVEHPLVTMNPEPGVDFLGFGADSMDFRIRAVLRDVNFSVPVTTEINHRIAERFAEEGIEIPFAQRDVWLRNPETLRAGARVELDAKPEKTEAVDPVAQIDSQVTGKGTDHPEEVDEK